MTNRIAGIVVVVVSMCVAIAAGEVSARLLDGYALTRASLFRRPAAQPAGASGVAADGNLSVAVIADRYVAKLPVPDGVDRAWFLTQPESFPAPPRDPVLEKRLVESPRHMMDRLYEFNELAIREFACKGTYGLNELDSVFVFSSYTGNRFPTYRYPQNKTLPSGLKTNRFGWRGPDLSLQRQKEIIRIAFVGASITVGLHGYDFSYPEFVGHWLNQWAERARIPQRFEVINAAHEGTNADDIAGEVLDVLRLVDPDLVVYYEGANQFWPADFIADGPVPAKPKLQVQEPSRLEQYSALAVRLSRVWRRGRAFGDEPPKPTLKVKWPPTLDEFNPDPDDPSLPLHLPGQLAQLEKMRAALEPQHGELAVSSFVWLAYPGMKLQLPRQDGIWTFLNQTMWPYSYAHIRRYADFQNRTFARYAGKHGLPFIDLAASFPQDPNLFRDAVHTTELALRLQGWVTFTELMPIVKARLHDGRWPRRLPDKPGPNVHPAFVQPVRLVKMADLRALCGNPAGKK